MSYSEIQIGKCCTPSEQTDPGRLPEKAFEYIDIASINKNSKRIVSTTTILGKDAPSRARKLVHEGDILVSTVRPNLNAVAIVPPELDGQIASTGFCVLRAKAKVLDERYLFYRTITTEFINFLVANMRGANYPAVTDAVVKETPIPLPPPKEQRRIVEILDQADELRCKRADADRKAERILPVLFIKMFGDPATNPKGWKTDEMGNLISLIRNGTTANQNKDGRGYAVTRIETISEGVINPNKVRFAEFTETEVDRWRLHQGDILFSHINSESHIGKTAIYKDEPPILIHGMNLLLIRPDLQKVTPIYLWALLNTDFVRSAYKQKCKRAVNQASLNQSDIVTLVVPKPPVEIQETFTEFIEQLYFVLNSVSVSRQKLEDLFSLLLQRAFSGELTAKWREAHLKELLSEMEIQRRELDKTDSKAATLF